MSSIQGLILEMKRDFIHGSSWYFEKLASALCDVNEKELEVLKHSIPTIRPGMAGISNIAEILKGKKTRSVDDVNELGRRLLDFKKKSSVLLKEEAKKIRIDSAITISYSQAVKVLIQGAHIKEVVLLKSSPGREWKTAAKDYGALSEVRTVPYSAMFQFMGEVDAVVIGFDGLFSNGYLANKVGSYPLCLSARELGKRVVAVGESYKSSTLPPGEIVKKEIIVNGKKIGIHLFDLVPINLVSVLLSDFGSFENPGGNTVEVLHRNFLKRLRPK